MERNLRAMNHPSERFFLTRGGKRTSTAPGAIAETESRPLAGVGRTSHALEPNFLSMFSCDMIPWRFVSCGCFEGQEKTPGA
jgi:hypothetical protein